MNQTTEYSLIRGKYVSLFSWPLAWLVQSSKFNINFDAAQIPNPNWPYSDTSPNEVSEPQSNVDATDYVVKFSKNVLLSIKMVSQILFQSLDYKITIW